MPPSNLAQPDAAPAVLADLHTAQSLDDAVKRIAALIGPKAYVSASVTTGRYDARPACVSVWPDDITGRNSKHFRAEGFGPALAEAEAWASTQAVVQRDATIRRLAFDIIDLTDQHGRCTTALLRARGHSDETIAEHRDAACARAGEMSGNAPFSVEA